MTPPRIAAVVLAGFLAGLPAFFLLQQKPRAAQETAEPQSDASKHFDEGEAALDAEDFDRAVGHFDKAIQISPKRAEFYLKRGHAYHGKEDYDRAAADYTEAIRLDPKLADAYYSRGLAHWEKKDLDKAVADFSEAIRLEPENVEFLTQRGRAYAEKKDFDRAVADLTEALRLDPKNVETYLERGYAYEEKKDYKRAVADYQEVLRLDPEESLAYNNLAWIKATCPDAKFRNGRLALEYAQQACTLTEWEEPWMFDTLAAAYAENGRFDEAVEWQRKSLEHPDSFEDEEEVQRAQKRLKLYQERKPYRDQGP